MARFGQRLHGGREEDSLHRVFRSRLWCLIVWWSRRGRLNFGTVSPRASQVCIDHDVSLAYEMIEARTGEISTTVVPVGDVEADGAQFLLLVAIRNPYTAWRGPDLFASITLKRSLPFI